MVVLICKAVRPGLRGELTRWMIEAEAGVFVGNIPGRVRQRLWQKVCEEAEDGRAMMLYSARTEQGFEVLRYLGQTIKKTSVIIASGKGLAFRNMAESICERAEELDRVAQPKEAPR